jgi:hypothetical protein
MKRTTISAALSLALFLSLGHAASAQVVAYHHRSTVWGDHLAGASELVRAQGSFLRDEAEAAESWVRAETARDDLLYRRAEYRLQIRQMEEEHRQAKAAARRERDHAIELAKQAEAVRLWKAAQHGGLMWPAALQKPEYEPSLAMIGSILRSWSPTNPTGDVYRRALATQAGVLRTRVASNSAISFQARVEAVRTLDRLQELSTMESLEVDATRLAMR